jgi:hypothetical protein
MATEEADGGASPGDSALSPAVLTPPAPAGAQATCLECALIGAGLALAALAVAL